MNVVNRIIIDTTISVVTPNVGQEENFLLGR